MTAVDGKLSSIPSERGFTLLELIVTLAIAAIITAIAVPNFSKYIADQRVKTSAQDLLMSLMYARSEAIKLNADVYVTAKDSDWAEGWVVTTVSGKTYQQCISDSAGCLRLQEAIGSVDISSSVTSLTYQRTGRTAATASFTVCDADGSEGVAKRVVNIGVSGQPRTRLNGTCAS